MAPSTLPPGGLDAQGAATATRPSESEAAIDPVCGMPVAADTTLRADHAGKSYAFCSTACNSAFTADPQRYAT